MELYIAKTSGFCFGVKKAFDTAIATTEDTDGTKPIYTFGPLIHNKDVVDYLKQRGADVVDSLDDLLPGTVIIRSHGVGEEFYDNATILGFEIVDSTCVFVKKVHKIVKKCSENNQQIIIVGDAKHPEVIGIVGWSKGNVIVIDSIEMAREMHFLDMPSCLVAQTTLNIRTWEAVSSYLKEQISQLSLYNTICSATKLRQDETEKLCKIVDFMLVVGGKSSSNTIKLYEIAKKNGINTQHIENVDEINVKLFQKYDKIGIVAGASTPDWVIDEVIQKLKSEGEVVVNGRQ